MSILCAYSLVIIFYYIPEILTLFKLKVMSYFTLSVINRLLVRLSSLVFIWIRSFSVFQMKSDSLSPFTIIPERKVKLEGNTCNYIVSCYRKWSFYPSISVNMYTECSSQSAIVIWDYRLPSTLTNIHVLLLLESSHSWWSYRLLTHR